jgi:AcrR family transcriptional regulator
VPNEKTDRRVTRTRKLLQEALIELILEKGYESLTVQEILERAGVGRSTFYAHFRDKDELLMSGFEHMRASLKPPVATGMNDGKILGFTRTVFENAYEHRRLYLATAGRPSGAAVQRQLRRTFKGEVRADLAKFAPGKAKQDFAFELAVEFVVNSLITVLTFWMDRKTPLPPAAMEERFRILVVPGLLALLHQR